MKIPTTIAALLGGIGLTLFSLWFGQNHHLMPVSATTTSSQVDGLFDTMLTISMGLFLLVQGTLLVAVVKFRRRPGDDGDGPHVEGNIPLEVLWTSIPAVIVLGIGIYSFEVYNNIGGLDPSASGGTVSAHHHHGGAAIAAPLPEGMAADGSGAIAPALPGGPGPAAARQLALGIGATPEARDRQAELAIDVLGLQYAWLFTYPDTGVVAGELHVPVGRDVQLNITAQDVIHALWVPQFRLKQDAIPGSPTQLRFVPSAIGRYPIVCAELCGAYHGAMRTEIVVESPEDYEAWMQSMVAAGPDAPAATVAVAPSTRDPATYLEARAADLGLDRDAAAAAIAQLQPD